MPSGSASRPMGDAVGVVTRLFVSAYSIHVAASTTAALGNSHISSWDKVRRGSTAHRHTHIRICMCVCRRRGVVTLFVGGTTLLLWCACVRHAIPTGVSRLLRAATILCLLTLPRTEHQNRVRSLKIYICGLRWREHRFVPFVPMLFVPFLWISWTDESLK